MEHRAAVAAGTFSACIPDTALSTAAAATAISTIGATGTAAAAATAAAATLLLLRVEVISSASHRELKEKAEENAGLRAQLSALEGAADRADKALGLMKV